MTRRRRKYFCRTVFTAAGLAAALILFGVYEILWAPNPFDGDRVITVSKGDTFRQIEDTLITSGVVRNRFLFNLAARLLGSTRKMQIGKC